MNFSKYISELRKDCNLTKAALAEKVGVTATYISNMEYKRNRAPDFEMCNKIANALKLSKKQRRKFLELALIDRLWKKDSGFIEIFKDNNK